MRALMTACLILCLILCSTTLRAHDPGVSRGDYAFDGRVLSVHLGMASGDFLAAFPQGDSDGDGTLDDSELAALSDQLPSLVNQSLRVLSASEVGELGHRCSPEAMQLLTTVEGDISLLADFNCPTEATAVQSRLLLTERLPFGHRHLAFSSGELLGVGDRQQPRLLHAAAISQASSITGVVQFVTLGAIHIAEGADHVLFVLVMLLASVRRKDLLIGVTAFTVGHSISLAVVSTGLWLPSPDWVEPVIALTIALSGLHLVHGRALNRILWPVGCVGLVHGLGFGGAMQELSGGQATPLASSLAFNLGVELGQLAILSVAAPLWSLLKRNAVAAVQLRRGSGGMIAIAGVWWLLSRTAMI